MGWQESMVALIPKFLLRIFAGPYIAGNSVTSALAKVDALWQEKGLTSTLDLLGEGIKTPEDIDAELQEYLRMVDAIGERTHVTLSLKPTQMGLAIDPALCQKNLETLLERTHAKGIPVTIDMEESDYTTATLTLFRTLRQSYDTVGTVLQSRLFRTADDIKEHLKGFKGHIRLCLGIYKEAEDIAYQKKSDMKDNFLRLAELLWDEGHFVAIATHDEALLRSCLELADKKGIPSERYEVQMLLGVPREGIQQEIVKQGTTVRLYVPYGTTWDHAYAYSRRRLIENPNIGFYVAGNLLRRFFRLL
jgi:proline dehydrogenase